MAGNRIKSKIAFEFLVFKPFLALMLSARLKDNKPYCPSTLEHGPLDREVRP